jgi:Protein of unknown function (DUF998)
MKPIRIVLSRAWNYIAFFMLFSAIQTVVLAQQKLPTIHSNAKEILIKHNSTTVTWRLDPSLKPDIYSIGSTLKEKKVRVITDIDSLSFQLHAGEQFDFIVLYQNKEACYTQIKALNDPFFFNPKAYVPLIVIWILVLLDLYLKRNNLSIGFLLKFGAISSMLFWVMIGIGGIIQENYSHTTMGVSALGTIGTLSEVFMAVSSMFLSVCCFLFTVGFYRASKALVLNTAPALLSISMSIAMAWGAIFPSGNEQHGLLGPLPSAIMLGALCVTIFWNKGQNYFNIRVLSFVSLLIMFLFVLRFIPSLQQQYEGLIQRSLWLGWSVWYISLSFYLSKFVNQSRNIKNPSYD